MSQTKTEARVNTGFIILYEEKEWLVGYYEKGGRGRLDSEIYLHILNKDAWGAVEKDYKLSNIPKTVREKYWFWLNMIST